jgi:hypothetical protein
MKAVVYQVKEQVQFQFHNQLWSQVSIQVRHQVYGPIRDQVWNQVGVGVLIKDMTEARTKP